MFSRRIFLQQTGRAAAGWCLLPAFVKDRQLNETVMTVNGPIAATAMQFTLSHEHVLCDFTGASNEQRRRYQEEDVYERAVPFLQDIKNRGCTTFIDCTPAYIGRDVALLKRLSANTGLHIISNTGYYGAADEKYLPKQVYTETAEQLANRWINEWEHGIEGTGIKPGFIKTGVDKGPLTTAQQKIIAAAAITHLATGLSIAVHTGDGKAADEQLRILANNRVAASARIWVHAQNETNKEMHIAAARAGSWVSFDGVHADNIKVYIDFLQNMKAAGLLSNTLVSQDAGWYTAGEANGGNYRDYNTVFTQLIPALKAAKFSDAEINLLFVTNPAKAFTVGVRKL